MIPEFFSLMSLWCLPFAAVGTRIDHLLFAGIHLQVLRCNNPFWNDMHGRVGHLQKSHGGGFRFLQSEAHKPWGRVDYGGGWWPGKSSWLLLLALHMPPSATYSSEKGPGWLYHQNSYCQSSRLSISPWKYHTSNSFPCSAVCSQMGCLGFMRFLCLSPKRPLTMLLCHNTWLYLFSALWCDGLVRHVFGDNEHQNLMKLTFPICS